MNTSEKLVTSVPFDANDFKGSEGGERILGKKVLQAIALIRGGFETEGLNQDFAIPPLMSVRSGHARVVGQFLARVNQQIGGGVTEARLTENDWLSKIGVNLRSFSLQPRTAEGDVDLGKLLGMNSAPTVGINARVEEPATSLRSALIGFQPGKNIQEVLQDMSGSLRARIIGADEKIDFDEDTLGAIDSINGVTANDNQLLVIQADIVDEALLITSGIPHRFLSTRDGMRDQLYFCIYN
ncbi:hypothetical protein KBD59_03900 [Candidatus Gracilibacteria bacterium]|nr:hypothetical protein [Candidatus Gracilibacteria bacterium]